MTALFSRWLPCATLSLWSIVMLYYAEAQGAVFQWMARATPLFSGRVDSFLVPAFRPLVLVAGLVLLLMALLFLFVPADAACCQAADCAHPLSSSAKGKWLTFLILIVPMAVAARFSPDGYSANVMKNRGLVTDSASLPQRVPPTVAPSLDLPLPAANSASATPAAATAGPITTTGDASSGSLQDYLQHTPEGYIQAEVLDLIYAAQDALLRKEFEGKQVQLIAQLMPDPGATAQSHRFKAVRMFMQCCAADARPVATVVEAQAPPNLPEMTWIKVVGTASFPVESGRRTAVLQAREVTKTEPPTESMLY